MHTGPEQKKLFLSHSHLPPMTISTFSTSSRCHGLILAAATFSLSSSSSSSSSYSSPPLSLFLSLSLSIRLTFSFSLSFSVFQTFQMIFSTPKKLTLQLAHFKNLSNWYLLILFTLQLACWYLLKFWKPHVKEKLSGLHGRPRYLSTFTLSSYLLIFFTLQLACWYLLKF